MPDNFHQVILIFRQYYKPIPLEIFTDPFQILVSTVLSARTKDNLTQKIALQLFSKAPDVYSLNRIESRKIARLIYPVGFYNTKAKHVAKLTAMLVKDYKGQVPHTRHDLMRLPGVGRKTANLVLNRAFGLPAIAVDTHVHRIANVLGWVKTDSPEQTERKLTKIIPKKYWAEVNRLFVSIGQQYPTNKKLIEFLQNANLV